MNTLTASKKSIETTDGNIPLGSLESPSKSGPNTIFIKVPSQGNTLLNLFKQFFNYAACLVFLPISITGRVIEALLSLKQRITQQHRSLEGKVVLITGASSGLGEALARSFYKEGCKLIIASRRYSELERVRDQLMGSNSRLKGGSVYPPVIIQLDLEEMNNLPDKIKMILGVYGHVDIIVNNAGISYRGEVIATTPEVDLRVMGVNYFGTVSLTKAVLPSMIERKSGHIVMIGSLQAKLALPFRSAYGASKHALQAFSDSLRAETKRHGIDVTVVHPGYIRTSLSLNALTGDGQNYGRMDETTESGADPAEAAQQILQAVKCKKDEILLCSLFYRLAVLLRTLLPSIYFWLMERRAAKTNKRN